MSDATTNTTTRLHYTDSDGVRREVRDCHMTVDKAGRHWLWSGTTGTNIAYKERSREDCLLSAIDSLLFIITLRDERIAALQRIADLAKQFADQVRPDEEGEGY